MSSQPNNKPKNKTQEIMDQVEEVKGIMHNNIDTLVKNVDNLEVLQDKSETMRDTSQQFKRNATTLKRTMWWKNLKLQLIIGFIVIAIIAVVVAIIVLKLKG